MSVSVPPQIDRSDIQGNVLRAYGNTYPCTAYVFVGIGEIAGGRAWLSEVADLVSSDEEWRQGKPRSHHNVAVTCAGLRALGVPEAMIATFSDEFCQGMAARSEMLGDLGASSLKHWDTGLGTGAAHVLVTVNARSRDEIEAELASLRDSIERAAGVSIVHEQYAELLSPPGGDPAAAPREQFGFSDGAAQPAITGVSDSSAPGGGVPLAGESWRPLALGEFVLGYPDEDTLVDPQRRLPSAPADPLGRSGTYVVYRKLRQDVALFRRVLSDAAARFGSGDEELLAAKVVGRWRNGTPLVVSPERPDPTFSATAPGSNAFRYLDVDVDGKRCPLGAHIRRSNPRDGLGWRGLDDSGLLSFRHRIIRRGVPYGPPLAGGALEDNGIDRGLVFVCFQASISRQFESVQLQWLNDGNGFRLGHDSDFLLGSPLGTGKMTVQGDPPFMLSPQGMFVTTRGGEYLFMPGIAALRALAGGLEG
jgi:Dyp-type peroxidase family